MPFDNLSTFDFEEQAVRIIMRDGNPWFVAADVCRVLELGNTAQSVSRLDEDERDGIITTDTIGREQQMTIISESGLYALVLTSRKDNARRFRKWITAEVIPSIRKSGHYVHPSLGDGGFDHLPGLDEISANDRIGWLGLIREARILGGEKAGRSMWAKSPLPKWEEPVITVSNQCLERFLQDCTVITGRAQDVTTAADLYTIYADWAARTGFTVWPPRQFALRMKAMSRDYVCPRSGRRFEHSKASVTIYRGMLLSDSTPHPDA